MASPKSEFDELKERWLQENESIGTNKRVRETTLGGNIVRWVREMLGEMSKENDVDTDGIECEGMNEEGAIGMTPEEKKECAFILRSLWKIKSMSKTKCGKGTADELMKDYVRCAVLNMWLHEYWDVHCAAQHVIENAFNTMKSLGALNPGVECKECEFKNLELMKIRGMPLLGYILNIVKSKGYVMKLINNRGPKPQKPCPPQKQANNAIFTVHHSNSNSIMTAEQFGFLSKLITQWVMARGTAGLDNFGGGIWTDLGTMFENLMSTLKGEEDEIRHLCKDGMDKNGEKIEPWKEPEKELCKAMIKVMLYTNGLTQKLGVRDKVEGEDEITTYLRCLVGTLVLVELYGEHCRFGRVLPHVSRVVKEKVKEKNLRMTEDICYNLNLEEVKVGGQLIGATIKEWINKGGWKSDKKVRNYKAIETQGKFCTQDATSEGAGSKSNAPGVSSETGVKEIREIMKEGKTVSQEDADNIIDSVSSKELMKEEDIKRDLGSVLEQKIKETIQKQKSLTTLQVNPNTCSISGLDDAEQENWDELFTQFSNVPSDADKNGVYDKWAGMKDVCEENVMTGKIWNQQEREFCEVLVRNLIIANEHKYKCEEQSTQLVEGKKKPCVGKCDLLTIWLTYVKGLCVSEELIKYAYEAMEQLETNWNGKDANDLCKYGETSNLYRDNNDILNIIIEKMKCEAEKGRMKGIHNSNWCTEKYRKYKVNVPDGVGRTGKSREEPTKGKQLVNKLKDIENRANGQLDEVKNTVESHLSSSSSPKKPPPPAAAPAPDPCFSSTQSPEQKAESEKKREELRATWGKKKEEWTKGVPLDKVRKANLMSSIMIFF